MNETMVLVGAVVVLLLVVAVLLFSRRPAGGTEATQAFALLAGKLEAVAATQERLAGSTIDRLAQQDRVLAERLEASGRRLDQVLAGQAERLSRTLADQAQRAQDTAGQIHERLAVIDAARQNMEALGGQVANLANILGNKQSRGAFGEMQLRQLIEDRLPPDGFSWQHTLSNGTRCDCLIHLPHPPGPIVVDSKFPLEAWQALREAGDEVAARKVAATRFAGDMKKHVDDIARKYLIAGETAEAAILFVPSEAIFAELHTGFAGVVDDAQRRRVYIASPTTLWAMLSAMRALMQDVRMRAQAGRIQQEVGRLVADVTRLNERVGKLKTHFTQAQDDIRQIDITTDKIIRAGGRIETVEIEETLPLAPPTAPTLR